MECPSPWSPPERRSHAASPFSGKALPRPSFQGFHPRFSCAFGLIVLMGTLVASFVHCLFRCVCCKRVPDPLELEPASINSPTPASCKRVPDPLELELRPDSRVQGLRCKRVPDPLELEHDALDHLRGQGCKRVPDPLELERQARNPAGARGCKRVPDPLELEPR